MVELVEILKNAKDVFIDKPGSSNNIALVLIHCEQFDLAEEVLNFGMEMSRRSANAGTEDEPIFLLNKLQIKRDRHEDLSPKETKDLETLMRTGSKLVQMGAAILLQQYDQAERLLKECLAAKLVPLEEVAGWPITKLLKPNLQDPTILLKVSDQRTLSLETTDWNRGVGSESK